MEADMPNHSDFELYSMDVRRLTPAQWETLHKDVVRRGREERARVMRAMVAGLGAAAKRVGAAIARQWTAYLAAWRRRRAVFELNGLDDRELKDIGLRRCEIYTAVYGEDAETERAVNLVHRAQAVAIPAIQFPVRREISTTQSRGMKSHAPIHTVGAKVTPTQKQLVQASWKHIVPIADAAASLFYQRLFEIDPSIRALFRHADMAQQRKQLVQMLAAAIAGLENLDALVGMVEDLGRRHAGYGVRDAHYDSVGAALLWTLEQGLGRAWNAELADAWAAAYGLLSGVMRRGAQTAKPAAPAAAA
jgi:hemoglobin-like flavoprotein/uncharacterized protein YjiS (DUF1127 family)